MLLLILNKFLIRSYFKNSYILITVGIVAGYFHAVALGIFKRNFIKSENFNSAFILIFCRIQSEFFIFTDTVIWLDIMKIIKAINANAAAA